MELKRILARDARSANEKAIAQYGPDVLVISSSQVNGLTELIVAVDIPPLKPEEAEPFVKSDLARPLQRESVQNFDVLLNQTLDHNKRAALERQATREPSPTTPTRSPAAAANPVAARSPQPEPAAVTSSAALADAQDAVRGREIVALVREEIASLRREFRLSQQIAGWQGGVSLAPALQPLRDALNEAPIPITLRALLLDGIQAHQELAPALEALRQQLEHSMGTQRLPMPDAGVHVFAGPSGGGKSLMVARLAQALARQHGSHAVMVISYHDHRAGAWSQSQLLHAQSGVDCFRATSPSALQLLLDEHVATRRVILIDTAGVQMNERLPEIRALGHAHQCHAVLPADASTTTLRRVFESPDTVWASLMLSKLDEASQPWALFQFLCERPLPLCVGSHGDGLHDLRDNVLLGELVQAALAQLPLDASTAEDAAARLAPAMTTSLLQRAQHQTAIAASLRQG